MSCKTSKKRNNGDIDLYRELDNMGYGSTSRGQRTVNYAVTGDQQTRQREFTRKGRRQEVEAMGRSTVRNRSFVQMWGWLFAEDYV